MPEYAKRAAGWAFLIALGPIHFTGEMVGPAGGTSYKQWIAAIAGTWLWIIAAGTVTGVYPWELGVGVVEPVGGRDDDLEGVGHSLGPQLSVVAVRSLGGTGSTCSLGRRGHNSVEPVCPRMWPYSTPLGPRVQRAPHSSQRNSPVPSWESMGPSSGSGTLLID